MSVFDVDRLLALDTDTADLETLDAAVRWARANPPANHEVDEQPIAQLLHIGQRYLAESLPARTVETCEAALQWSGNRREMPQAAVYNTMASSLGDLGQLDRAVSLQAEAIEIFRQADPPQLSAVFACLFNRGNTLRHAGRLEEAQDCLLQAESLIPEVEEQDRERPDDIRTPIRRFEAKIKHELGVVAHRQKDFERALESLQEALDFAVKTSDGELYLMVGKAYVDAALDAGRFGGATEIAARMVENVCVPSLQHGGNEAKIVPELINCSGRQIQSLAKQNRIVEAEAAFDRSCEWVDQAIPNNWDLKARYYEWQAGWLEEFGRTDERIDTLQEALQSAQKTIPLDADLERSSTIKLLFAYQDAKLHRQLESFVRDALTRPANHEDRKQCALLESNLSSVLDRLGQHQEGLELVRQSQSYFLDNIGGQESEVASCALLIVNHLRNLGATDQIEPTLLEAKLALAKHGGYSAKKEIVRVNDRLIEFHQRIRLGENQQSPAEQRKLEALLQENRDLAKETGQGGNDLDYARYLCRSGSLDECEQLLQTIAQSLEDKDADRYVETAVELAKAHERKLNSTAAARVFVESANVASRLNAVHYSESLVAALVRLGQIELATRMAAHMRNRDDEREPPTWQIHQRLSRAYDSDREAEAIGEIDRAIRNLGGKDDKALLQLVRQRRTRFQSLIEKSLVEKQFLRAWQLAEQMSQSDSSFQSIAEDAERFFGDWSDQASVLCFYALHDKVLIVNFEPNSGRAITHVIEDSFELSRSVSTLYEQAFNNMLGVIQKMNSLTREFDLGFMAEQEYSEQFAFLDGSLQGILEDPQIDVLLARIYEILIKPVEDVFRAESVVAIVAESFLASIPFYALYDSRRKIYLIDRGADLFFLPTLGDLRNGVRRRKSRLGRRGLFVAPDLSLLTQSSVPDTNGNGDSNAGSAELEAAEAFANECKLLCGIEASLRNLQMSLPHSDFVHFVSHGQTDFRDPEQAGILLAGGERLRSGLLTQCSPDSLWMAVLGSCYGASYRETYAGESGTSLALDFVRHGVPLVIGSLWFVAADAAESIMTHFYKRLGDVLDETTQDKSNGRSPNLARAFRMSLLDTRDEFPHIFDWALFYPLGDFSPQVQGIASTQRPIEGVAGRIPTGSSKNDAAGQQPSGATRPTDERIDRIEQETLALFQTMSGEDFKCMLQHDTPPTRPMLRWVELMYEILEIDPLHKGTLMNLTQLGENLIPPGECLALAERLAEAHPSFEGLTRLGRVLVKQQQYRRAVNVLEQSRELGADFNMLIQLAVAKANTGSLQEALECVENGMKLADDDQQIKDAADLRDQILAGLNRTHG